ncbi:hypothetical protein TNCT_517221 [Trichonephila clavata]|uniref:Uncharacterized protein n=1 Tax=Trichonephila clavata TaxID=2740835 RepID=A0A8X6LY75_TRICU|nr:hypothetical protein TNCT_517221 [Trichonephila clavata]
MTVSVRPVVNSHSVTSGSPPDAQHPAKKPKRTIERMVRCAIMPGCWRCGQDEYPASSVSIGWNVPDVGIDRI